MRVTRAELYDALLKASSKIMTNVKRSGNCQTDCPAGNDCPDNVEGIRCPSIILQELIDSVKDENKKRTKILGK
jgi:hypothetical protein